MSEDIHIFLIDTKIKSPTAPLVEHFKKLREDTSYLDKFDNEYVPLVSKCIKSMTDKKDDEFFNYAAYVCYIGLYNRDCDNA